MTTNPTAAVLIIGSEILSGRTQDLNLQFIARELGEKGILLKEARVVPDVEVALVAAVKELSGNYSYVFATGGIGATHDDITVACVAKAFGRKIVMHEKALKSLEDYYREIPGGLTDIRRRMANVPEGAILLDNPLSGAPGFCVGNVYIMPGVPVIMQAMLKHFLPGLPGGPPVVSESVECPLPESFIADGLAEIQARYPDLDLGSYPRMKGTDFRTTLVAKGTDAAAVKKAAAEIAAMVERMLSKSA